jgi:Protein of unknown function (DUF2846)
MKALLAVLILTSSAAFAQEQPTGTAIAPGCGPSNAKFEVKTDAHQHPVTRPEGGKALVYFIEDDTKFLSRPRPTTRVGVDGTWVGAAHNNSYLYFSVAPGEHHLCASWQTTVALGAGHKTAAAHFTAEDGGVYYFRVKNSWNREYPADIEFGPLDSDEAQLLMSKFSLSTSHPK